MVCLWFFFMPFAPPEATGSATGSATLSSPPKEPPPPPPEVPMPEPEAGDGTDVTDLGEVMDARPGKHTKSYGIDGP